MSETIVVAGDNPGPLPHDLNPFATRTQLRPGLCIVEQVLKGSHTWRWDKVVRKPLPVVAVMLAQQGDQALFSVVRGWLL
jgi:hypothetical protein